MRVLGVVLIAHKEWLPYSKCICRSQPRSLPSLMDRGLDFLTVSGRGLESSLCFHYTDPPPLSIPLARLTLLYHQELLVMKTVMEYSDLGIFRAQTWKCIAQRIGKDMPWIGTSMVIYHCLPPCPRKHTEAMLPSYGASEMQQWVLGVVAQIESFVC